MSYIYALRPGHSTVIVYELENAEIKREKLHTATVYEMELEEVIPLDLSSAHVFYRTSTTLFDTIESIINGTRCFEPVEQE